MRSSQIGAEDRWYLSIGTARTSICRPYSALVSTEVLCAAPSELGISRHLACAIGTLQGLTGTISPSREKPCKVFLSEDPGSNLGCITMSRIQRTQPYKMLLPGLFSPLMVSVQCKELDDGFGFLLQLYLWYSPSQLGRAELKGEGKDSEGEPVTE